MHKKRGTKKRTKKTDTKLQNHESVRLQNQIIIILPSNYYKFKGVNNNSNRFLLKNQMFS